MIATQKVNKFVNLDSHLHGNDPSEVRLHGADIGEAGVT